MFSYTFALRGHEHLAEEEVVNNESSCLCLLYLQLCTSFRWHVRTKDNIARVRRDEAKAAEEEKAREQRALLAEQEARTALLRSKARERLTGQPDQQLVVAPEEAREDTREERLQHVNFFQDLEDGETTHTDNRERQEEKKREQEDYEKKIGLLTYLGQDTHELTGDRPWWEKLPENRAKEEDSPATQGEAGKSKLKDSQDPLNDFRRYLSCDGVKKYLSEGKRKRKRSPSPLEERKKHKKKKKKSHKSKKSKKSKKRKRKRSSSSSSSSESDSKEAAAALREERRRKVERLRLERLEREKKERARAQRLLNGENPDEDASRKVEESDLPLPTRKYNSQFNPQFAKQNKLDAGKKYWLE